jgi:hypothetical protein
MIAADPDEISRDAMNLFIEKLTESRDRVGIISYAGEVEKSTGLVEIETDALREIIGALNYASWTDHGAGLIEALRILRENHCGERQGVVIFLTDGNMNVNPQSGRTNEIAQEDVHAAIYAARELNIPIHTIGLNFDGNLAVEYINYIAESTQGLSFETANAADIPEIIDAFFYAMIRTPQKESEPLPPDPKKEFTYVEKIYEKVICEKEIYENNSSLKTIVAAGSALALGLSAFAVSKKKSRRVFTGKLVIETPNKKICKNLIEYGNRVTLGALIGNASVNAVVLTPSPTAPSHLPQLQIKCKNPQIKFTKDFFETDITQGVALGTSSEATIEAEGVLIYLRYI